MLAHSFGNEKCSIFRPTVMALSEPDFFLTQRFSMRRAGILFVRRTVGDMAIDDNQRRSIGGIFESCKGAIEHLQIIGIAHPRDVPTVADEACGHVIAES